ncbi:hypothetical protein [Lysobacter sp. Root667]|uniref:hypothetical protein n=1 Tax=Lysobacter sp. Root667 TaxID=1736581 RepID=UPI0012DDBA6F|nr:hypothetical protein [Lysobacter sp. Root667]
MKPEFISSSRVIFVFLHVGIFALLSKFRPGELSSSVFYAFDVLVAVLISLWLLGGVGRVTFKRALGGVVFSYAASLLFFAAPPVQINGCN